MAFSQRMRLRGGALEFGAKGVRPTRGNVLEDVTVCSPDQEAAVLIDAVPESTAALTQALLGLGGSRVPGPGRREAVGRGHGVTRFRAHVVT
ncbi:MULTISPECIES: hypothetical protein [Streptomyces]|uniref:Uncharacterized protein n=1 Tax=Streptomyces spororaveus TaxID=284039 RepID=A0ABQ3T5Q8_9ACTN|nr:MULTISPECIES: hypothetical protein [Streptomyces]MCX5301874.1 hypothetical protein [Streptomyces sp. NBC_00160]GHI75733.1 hypothetical protein Sspor_12940 [Streptomyces spororaveus]